MTRQEIELSWQRYMHRTDIGTDLNNVYTFAAQMISERILARQTPSVDDILANSPRTLLHAGLMYLHELAQDDTGLMREQARFNEAIAGYARRSSLNNTTPRMKPEHTPI